MHGSIQSGSHLMEHIARKQIHRLIWKQHEQTAKLKVVASAGSLGRWLVHVNYRDVPTPELRAAAELGIWDISL